MTRSGKPRSGRWWPSVTRADLNQGIELLIRHAASEMSLPLPLPAVEGQLILQEIGKHLGVRHDYVVDAAIKAGLWVQLTPNDFVRAFHPLRVDGVYRHDGNNVRERPGRPGPA